jgi:uncharacterized protein YabN with tetrapyrrole methylase and pyrophosphatase domain
MCGLGNGPKNPLGHEIKRLILLEQRYAEFGFDWPDTESILNQIMSEVAEVKKAIQEKESPIRIQEEIGDVLHAVLSLVRFSGLDLDALLMNANDKFESRCEAMKVEAAREGVHSFKGLSFDEMLRFWELAKRASDK